jgi:hypothetical protein
MMAQPKFDIQIDKDGKVTVRVHGVSGAQCIELSDMIRGIVGHETSRELTAEYYGGPGHVRNETRVQGRSR